MSFNFDDDEEGEDDEEAKEHESAEAVGIDDGDATSGKEENLTNSKSESGQKRKRFGKNPDVDTSFLPDVERDEEEIRLREQLRLV